MPEELTFHCSAQKYRDALPAGCLGTVPLLSGKLYRVAKCFTQSESIGEIYKLCQSHDQEDVVSHLVLLPERNYSWILGGFLSAVQNQSDKPGDDLTMGCMYLSMDLKSGGYGEITLAPKEWAAEFLDESLRRRPLPPPA